MKSLATFAAAITIVLAASCASVPERGTEPGVELQLLTRSDLKRMYGSNFSTNPYIEPHNLITRQPREFAVLRLRLALADRLPVSVIAKVVGADGAELARHYDLEYMKDFTSTWGTGDVDVSRRINILEHSYLQSLNFTGYRGSRDYMIILMGNYPMPRPATVQAQVVVGSGEAKLFDFELPPVDTKF